MKKLIIPVALLLLAVPAFPQFMPYEPPFNSGDIGLNLNTSGDVAGLLNHLQMEHSISMSVGSSGLGNMSTMAYQNRFMLPINSKMRLTGTLSFVQPTYSSGLYSQLPGYDQTQVYYDTNLEYNFNSSTKLNIGLTNRPVYYYNPYYRNYGVSGLWQIPE